MNPDWESFVSKHLQAVLNSALRVVGNSTDAEDLAQDVFLEILRNQSMATLFDQPALLRTMAMRRGLDRLRKRRLADTITGLEPDIRQHEPIHYSIAGELDGLLQKELAGLPPREAEVFCLTYFECLSPPEIAELLKISRGAVAKSLSVARSRLSIAFGKIQAETQS